MMTTGSMRDTDDAATSAAAPMTRDDRDRLDASALDARGAAALLGSANVIMQLANPAVGHGVRESRVDSGNLFIHPIKRTRTTLSYIAVAVHGTPDDRRAYRRAVGTSHARVRSTDESPVAYNAFDPALQLWVAACLYRGWEDVQRFFGDPAALTEDAYRQGAVFGTTLQMPHEMWPATRADFQRYWDEQVAGLRIDPEVRTYLRRVARAEFLTPVVSVPLGWWFELLTVGFLPDEFRALMGYRFAPWQQRVFDAHNTIVRAVVTRLPTPLRDFPFNALLADVRRRTRAGKPLV